MASLFGSNPFSSPVGQRIERATDSILPSEDWALIMEICDIINETEEGPRDAIKAFKKRLSHHKNAKAIMYTVTALEACVKNCGHRFHSFVASKDFLAEFPKILGQKGSNQIPQVLKEKILQVIQAWSDAFRNASDLQAIVHLYNHLKSQGYEFPAQDLDSLSPIYTPERSVHAPENNTSAIAQADNPPMRSGSTRPRQTNPLPQQMPVQEIPQAGPIQPTPEQLAKLRTELDIVQNNSQVMSEMLTELKPGEEDPSDRQLLKELNGTCRQMKQRLMELLECIANEEVTGELLRVNDVLNNIFLRYDRFERKVNAIANRDSSALNNESNVQPRTEETQQSQSENMLIDFGAGTQTSPTTATPSQQPPAAHTDDFDMFAQSRSSTFTDSRRGGSTYDDNSVGVPVASSIAGAMNAKGPYPPQASPAVERKENDVDSTDDIQDVEEWLKDTNLAAQIEEQKQIVTPKETEGDDKATVSSAEFDRFLSERSMAGPQRVTSTRQPIARQMDELAGDKNSDKMFAL